MIARLLKNTKGLKYIIFYVIFSILKDGRRLRKCLELKDSDDLLLVANGPSLNNTPLHDFKCDSMGLNKINLIFNKTTWRPKYITVTNGLVMQQTKKFYTNSDIQVFAEYKARFLGMYANNIAYFLTRPDKNFHEDVVNGVGASGTVTFAALQLAVALGYRRIFIVGLDHSFAGYSSDVKNSPLIERFEGDDINHFDPNYFKGMKWGVPNLYDSERGYQKALEWAKFNGVEIFDCTVEGNCDVFPKMSIADAIRIIEKG